MTGFATSVIGCGCEAGIDRELAPEETPDGRPGRARAAVRRVDRRAAEAAAGNRVGQCVLTSPGSACYAGLDGEERLQARRRAALFRRRLADLQDASAAGTIWRIPVMDGEFLCEATTGLTKSGGRRRQPADHGRTTAPTTLQAAEAAVEAIARGAGRHPAVSRRHRALGLEGRLEIQGAARLDQRCLLPDAARRRGDARSTPTSAAVLEIVIDGLTAEAVADAMRAGLAAIVRARRRDAARCASAPAITAASSGRTISI